MASFKLTPRQQEANTLLAGTAQHVMLYGGSRSGKTFLLVRAVIVRALKAPNSRHVILRYRYNAVKASIIADTFPKVMRLCFAGLEYKINTQDGFATLPNGSQVWFGGLDDKERTEKILGQEFGTIYLNECSQIPKASRDIAVTRLAQVCPTEINGVVGPPLTLRMLYDANPPTKGHWTYKLFHQHVDPDTRKPLPDPENYAFMQINPGDNQANLPDSYIQTLKSLPERLQRRFLLGEFADDNPDALFREGLIDLHRAQADTPDFVRVVVAVDPSGSRDEDNSGNDAIGVVVAALGMDGECYVLEDLTVKASPKVWGTVVASAFDRHAADVVVGEENFGGAMVEFVVQTCRPNTKYKTVKASRGKAVRAEPFSALYEQGKVHHVGYFPELEEELCAFSTHGYTGQGSPNRADALIWALAELFPAMVKPVKEPLKLNLNLGGGRPGGWMG